MTDYEDPATYDNGYYESLSSPDQERFEDAFEKNLGEFDQDAIERTLKAKYDSEDEHLKLIKAVGACFHPKEGAASNSGFKFSGVSPLSGTNSTPSDAILVNSEHNCVHILIIFCEIGSERVGEWVENVNKTHSFIRKQRSQKILNERLNINRRDIEIGYVTITREDDTPGIDFSVMDRNCDPASFAVWECDTSDKWLRYVDGSNFHQDLETEFQDEIDYSKRKEPVNFAVGTHPIFPLEEIIFKVIKENYTFKVGKKDEFEENTFVDFYQDELKVFTQDGKKSDIVAAEASRVLEAGENVRILTSEDSEVEERDYKVVYSGARGPEHAQAAVKTRYFNNMPEFEVGRKSFQKTKDEFDKTTGLNDFG